MENQETIFALVHGAWHNKWCWNLLRDELEGSAHETIAMDLPIDDPSKNFDDCANVIYEHLEGKENIVGVFHSRAGNYGPRAVRKLLTQKNGDVAVKKMIFLAASFEPSTVASLGRPQKDEYPPQRNTNAFKDAIIQVPIIGEHMTIFDPECAEELFYHDVKSEKLVEEAITHLRPHNRSIQQPVMPTWPQVPMEYILCEDDRIVRPEWSRYVSQNWLDIEPISIPGGHSPFLSRPKVLANTLIELAHKDERY